jgi:hypothetical protein
MKPNRLLVVSLGALLAASGWAQDRSPIRVQVPFEFSAGSTTLPAGEYRVSEQVPGIVKIAAEQGKHSIMLLAAARLGSEREAHARLVFTRYGAHYFLSEVWGLVNDKSYELQKTPAEKEYAGRAAPIRSSVAAAIH